MTHPSDIYLRSIAAELPEEIVPLEDLRLRSSAEVLAGFGFTGAAIAKDLDALTLRAAERALSRAGIAPNDCGALLYTGALTTSHTHKGCALIRWQPQPLWSALASCVATWQKERQLAAPRR